MVEKYYAVSFNRAIIQVLSISTGIFPFSLAEIGLICLTVAVGWKGLWTIVSLAKREKLARAIVIEKLVKILIFFSMIYFMFILLWGLNYYRLTFADIAHFEVRSNSAAELTAVCNSLIDHANQLRTQVDETKEGVMKISGRKANILGQAAAGYQGAEAMYPELGGRYGKPKGILLSEPMSYLGLTGVYCPFTGEPNVNMAIPDAMLPAVVCHEMAHQRGFAREDEANYIAYVTCKMNPDPDFQYSGYLLAVINSMNMLEKYDINRYQQLQQRYNKGVRDDLDNNSEYWNKHYGFTERIINNVNDLYLKSNRQSAGVASYNRMVDLLIAEYRVEKDNRPVR